MELTPIGAVCFLAALVAFLRPLSLGLVIIAAFIPLQAAAAINLPSVGGLSLICAHILVGAVAAGVAARPRLLATGLRFAATQPAIIALVLFVAYGAMTGFFMPRLFTGEIQVYSFARPPEGVNVIPLVGLRPTTGNITQPFYLAVDAVLFLIACFALSRPGGMRRAGGVVNAVTIVHIAFGVISALPNPATAAILDFIRTANYSILAHHTMAGFARIIGSYSEASAFGTVSIGLFAWNILRFLQTRSLWHIAATAATFACVVVSFSTTAYAVVLLLVLIWSMHTFYKLIRAGLGPEHLTAMFLSIMATIAVFVLLFYDPARELAGVLYEKLFGSKLESDSGIERTAWNMQALRNFIDTFGIGVGLGGARTSSLVTGLLGNTGVPGVLLYCAFLYLSFLRPWPLPEPKERDAIVARRLFIAGRGAALAVFLANVISGGIDCGLVFFLFAGVATAAVNSSRARITAPDSRLFAAPPPLAAAPVPAPAPRFDPISMLTGPIRSATPRETE